MRPTQITNEDKLRSGDWRGMNRWENLHIFNAELTGRGAGGKAASMYPPTPSLLHTNEKISYSEKETSSKPVFLRPQILPGSRQGFASVVLQENFHREISRGQPAEGSSSSLKTSRQAAGICQDGCYWAKQKGPCPLSSAVETKQAKLALSDASIINEHEDAPAGI